MSSGSLCCLKPSLSAICVLSHNRGWQEKELSWNRCQENDSTWSPETSPYWPAATSLMLCRCFRARTVCVCASEYECLQPLMRPFFSLRSVSLPHISVHVLERALLSLSNWWSFQIKMNLHHANRGSGEQSASFLQSAGIAGGLSLLSSGLSLNPLATLPSAANQRPTLS